MYSNLAKHLKVWGPELTRPLHAYHFFNLVAIFLFMKYNIPLALLKLHHTIDSYRFPCQVKPTISSTHTIPR